MTNLKMPSLKYDDLINRKNGRLGYATTLTHGNPGTVIVSHHGSPIATLTPDTVTLDNHGYHSNTTAHRLNLISHAHGLGWVGIKNGEMRLTRFDGTITPMNGPITLPRVDTES